MVVFTNILSLLASLIFCYQIAENNNLIYLLLLDSVISISSLVFLIMNRKRKSDAERSIINRNCINIIALMLVSILFALLSTQMSLLIKIIVNLSLSMFLIAFVINTKYKPYLVKSNYYSIVILSIINYIIFNLNKNVISYYVAFLIIIISILAYLLRKKTTSFNVFISSSFFAGLIIIFFSTPNIISYEFLLAPSVVIFTTGEDVKVQNTIINETVENEESNDGSQDT